MHAKDLKWYMLNVFKEHERDLSGWSRRNETGNSRRKGWGRSRACS